MTITDKQNIYDALVQLLTTQCNTCIDKERKNKITLCAFILELIDYAESVMQPACILTENGLRLSTEDFEWILMEDASDAEIYDSDSDRLWEYLARVLNVSLEEDDVIQTNYKCKNGVCTLC